MVSYNVFFIGQLHCKKYNTLMEILKTRAFDRWFRRLRNPVALVQIGSRLERLAEGDFGDASPITGGKGIKELRFFIGPGYRVYFKQYGAALVVLLCGGDKDSQSRDIEAAKRLAAEYEDNNDG